MFDIFKSINYTIDMIKKVAWNKGIDHLSVDAKKRIGDAVRLRCKEGKHPKGMLGKKHTKETKIKQSKWRPNEEQLKKMTHHKENHGMWLGKRKILICKVCKIKKEVPPNSTQQYCSKVCSNKGHGFLMTGVKYPLRTLPNKKCEVCKIKVLSSRNNKVCNPCKGLFYSKSKYLANLQSNIRGSIKYENWRKSIFERDNYTCQICNERGNKIQVDHFPFPLSVLIKLEKIKTLKDAYKNNVIWNLEISRTLCVNCHKKTESYLNVKYTKGVFEKIIKDKKIYKVFKTVCNLIEFIKNDEDKLLIEEKY